MSKQQTGGRLGQPLSSARIVVSTLTLTIFNIREGLYTLQMTGEYGQQMTMVNLAPIEMRVSLPGNITQLQMIQRIEIGFLVELKTTEQTADWTQAVLTGRHH